MKNLIYYLIIAGLTIALLFTIQKCSGKERYASTNFEALNDTIKYYKNALGDQTASVQVLKLEKEDFKAVILKQDAELQRLAKPFAGIHNVIKYKTITTVDTIYINYADTLPCIFERSGKKRNDWYTFNYKSNQRGIQIDSLVTNTETTLITGMKRKWFLGEQTLVTDITNSNPHIKVTSLKAAEIRIPEPWYKKWYLWLAAGAVGGIIATR